METCTDLDEKWSTGELRRDEATKQLSDRSVLRWCASSLRLTPRETPSRTAATPRWRYILRGPCHIITSDASYKSVVYVTETDYDRVHARQNTPRDVYIKRIHIYTLDARRATEGASCTRCISCRTYTIFVN